MRRADAARLLLLAAIWGASFLFTRITAPVFAPVLTAELRTGRIGAAVDVTDPEPLPPDHPLWELPNFLLTPHVGGAVPGLMRRALRVSARPACPRRTSPRRPF